MFWLHVSELDQILPGAPSFSVFVVEKMVEIKNEDSILCIIDLSNLLKIGLNVSISVIAYPENRLDFLKNSLPCMSGIIAILLIHLLMN